MGFHPSDASRLTALLFMFRLWQLSVALRRSAAQSIQAKYRGTGWLGFLHAKCGVSRCSAEFVYKFITTRQASCR
ncbi:hypothetical protein LZ32DRAFT_193782 [Colletotrichum eremochloae]|nr:hypothetical protein LZ32DRAFT_193782 [Colletotrichum eremochloae]